VRILITGAAGFVGAHAVAYLSEAGHEVVATDRVPVQAARRLTALVSPGAVRYLAGELAEQLPAAMSGVDQVWHLAANADIPLGVTDTRIDLRESPMLTREVLESMREHRVDSIVFPSTSGVYGSVHHGVLDETAGPLLPNSMYAAGKLASEGLISAYCATFGLQARIFRLGNVVGGRMGRGIVRDFVGKLRRKPAVLDVLGDGTQRKSYVLIDDVIAGMAQVGGWPAQAEPRCDVYNLAAGDSADVAEVARAVADALGIPPPRLVPTGASWQGDQPVIELSIAKALATGWRPANTAQEAVRIAAQRLLGEPEEKMVPA